jgi:hypothetical protein
MDLSNFFRIGIANVRFVAIFYFHFWVWLIESPNVVCESVVTHPFETGYRHVRKSHPRQPLIRNWIKHVQISKYEGH